VFEAAGAGACLITDSWPGIDQFFAPEREILVADSAEVIVELLNKISKEEATQIGAAMKDRALRDHTYALRAAEVSEIFSNAYAEKAA
jgi:spore maturation protein CgeB